MLWSQQRRNHHAQGSILMLFPYSKSQTIYISFFLPSLELQAKSLNQLNLSGFSLCSSSNLSLSTYKYLLDLEASSIFELSKLVIMTDLVTFNRGLWLFFWLWRRVSVDVYWIYWRYLFGIVESIGIIWLIVGILMLNVRVLILSIRIILRALLIIPVGRLIMVNLRRIWWIVVSHIIDLLVWTGLVSLGNIWNRLSICDGVLL